MSAKKSERVKQDVHERHEKHEMEKRIDAVSYQKLPAIIVWNIDSGAIFLAIFVIFVSFVDKFLLRFKHGK